jgi:hypothetical protein
VTLVIVVLLLIGAAPRPPTPLSRSRPAVLDTRQGETRDRPGVDGGDAAVAAGYG